MLLDFLFIFIQFVYIFNFFSLQNIGIFINNENVNILYVFLVYLLKKAENKYKLLL